MFILNYLQIVILLRKIKESTLAAGDPSLKMDVMQALVSQCAIHSHFNHPFDLFGVPAAHRALCVPSCPFA